MPIDVQAIVAAATARKGEADARRAAEEQARTVLEDDRASNHATALDEYLADRLAVEIRNAVLRGESQLVIVAEIRDARGTTVCVPRIPRASLAAALRRIAGLTVDDSRPEHVAVSWAKENR